MYLCRNINMRFVGFFGLSLVGCVVVAEMADCESNLQNSPLPLPRIIYFGCSEKLNFLKHFQETRANN